MTELDTLVAAIVAAPDDDGPRLVYADALIERGEVERGELIVAQCSGNEARANALLEGHTACLLGELAEIAVETRFERGFIVSMRVSIDVDTEWDHGGDITATPNSGGEWNRLAKRAHLQLVSRAAHLPLLRDLSIGFAVDSWGQRFYDVMRDDVELFVECAAHVPRVIVTWYASRREIILTLAGDIATIEREPGDHFIELQVTTLRSALPKRFTIR